MEIQCKAQLDVASLVFIKRLQWFNILPHCLSPACIQTGCSYRAHFLLAVQIVYTPFLANQSFFRQETKLFQGEGKHHRLDCGFCEVIICLSLISRMLLYLSAWKVWSISCYSSLKAYWLQKSVSPSSSFLPSPWNFPVATFWSQSILWVTEPSRTWGTSSQ